MKVTEVLSLTLLIAVTAARSVPVKRDDSVAPLTIHGGPGKFAAAAKREAELKKRQYDTWADSCEADIDCPTQLDKIDIVNAEIAEPEQPNEDRLIYGVLTSAETGTVTYDNPEIDPFSLGEV